MNSWVEISKSAINHNLKIYKKIIGPKVKLMPVVKSNAYGHGLVEIASILEQSREVEVICTVNLTEALELRQNKIKKPLLVLSFYDLNREDIKQAINKNIALVVYAREQIEFINKIALTVKKKAKVHLKIDTGTSRLGTYPKEGLNLAILISKKQNLQLEGLFTHYASAEEPDQKFTGQQTKIFYDLVQQLEKKNILIPLKHSACSAAIIYGQAYHFDAVRLGISLYGLWSLEDGHYYRSHYKLKPALSWKTKIIQLKEVKKGETVGYGRSFQAKKDLSLAVLPIGYWDGYDRKLSNQGEVLIKGKRCKVLGRVCMNLIMVDVSGSKAKVGDEAVLIGRQGKQEITADELAKKVGTINYEIVTRINPLIKRLMTK